MTPTPEDLAKYDQSFALVADMLPAFWWRLYKSLVAQGFAEAQALDLLKTYIMANGSKQ